jgi:hypothetical protein
MANGWGGRRPGSGPKKRKPHISGSRDICVYIIDAEGQSNICKVGISDRVVRRLATLQTGNWHKLRIFAAYRMPDLATAASFEDQLLTFYSTLIRRGEWIAAGPADVQCALERGMRSIDIEPVNVAATENTSAPHLKIIKFEKRKS